LARHIRYLDERTQNDQLDFRASHGAAPKNRKFHRGINNTPYNALFGRESFDGLEEVKDLSKEQKKNLIDARSFFTLIGRNLI